ncbi:MAG TPA: glycosyltransferase [Anaerolineae bacterium]|nr:glycosyltransferase [Anaerolineae bacterium]
MYKRSINSFGSYEEPIEATEEAIGPLGRAVPEPNHPELSIIVPTKNEAKNIERLVSCLEKTLVGTELEIIFVDDSTDDTPQVIQEVSERASCTVTLIARPPERHNGLGMAVVEGIRKARSDWICVMDGDLQHPPEVIPQLMDEAQSTKSDLVIASRLVEGGSTEGLGLRRAIISYTLAWISRVAFPQQLRKLSDPLTGFFLLRRTAVDPEQLHPDGFKILLDILVRNPQLRVSEIPFEFGHRYAGQSKANSHEVFRLFRHMFKLRLQAQQYLISFLIVGLSGLIINNILMAFFVEFFGLHYLLSAVLATQGSTVWNFAGTEMWVFRDRQQPRKYFLRRLISFLLMNNAMLLLRGPMLTIFISWLGMHYLSANLLSLILMTLLRFAIADRLIWRKGEEEIVNTQKLYQYNIHNIIRIRSMQRLPELVYFQTDEVMEQVDFDVRIDKNIAAYKQADSICYDELLGQYGFSIVINQSETRTDIIATPTISRSPHVLYTNVVEPLLRWHFVRRGYALMHGACLDFNGKAVFVTAKTDTGKTTTILHTIRSNAKETHFLSDDMTIFSQDGRVLSYPKPLTISQHTVQAIGGAPLTINERLFLIVQSRLHSRNGRWLGMLLCENGLPGATLNALVQMIIPPPKFMVDRLIPQARYINAAQLAKIVLIERGPDHEEAIPEQDRTDILLTNADDAYGFPPYPKLASALSNWHGEDLHHVERRLVEATIKGVPGIHLRSTRYDWYKRLPQLVDGHRVSSNGHGPSLKEWQPTLQPIGPTPVPGGSD